MNRPSTVGALEVGALIKFKGAHGQTLEGQVIRKGDVITLIRVPGAIRRQSLWNTMVVEVVDKIKEVL